MSALVTDPGRRGVTSLCVPAVDGEVPAPRYEALRERVARALDRPLRLHLREGAPGDSCDLSVVSVHEWQASGARAGLEPVAVVEGARGAVVIAGRDGPREISELKAGSVLFMAPHSLNGCWIQLSALRQSGVVTPRRMDALRFAPAPGRAERVVFEVALGRSPAGAVPGGVLDDMISDGRVVVGEVRVIDVSPGLPEVLLCRQRGQGPGVDGLIREGLMPVTGGDLERIDALFRMAGSMGWE